MTAQGTSLETIAGLLGAALRPVVDALDADEAGSYVAELGWDLPTPTPPAFAGLQSSIAKVADASSALEEQRLLAGEGGADDDSVLEKIGDLAVAVLAFAVDLARLPDALRSQLPAAYLSETGIADAVVQRLLDDSVVRAISDTAPILAAILDLAGFMEEEPQDPDPAHHQSAYIERRLRLDRIGTFLNDPPSVYRDNYGWGTPQIDAYRLFNSLRRLSFALLIPAEIRYPTPTVVDAISPGATISAADGPDPILIVPLVAIGGLALELGVLPCPKRDPSELQGIALTLAGETNFSGSLRLTPNLALSIDTTIDITTGLALVIRPDGPPTVIASPGGTPATAVSGHAVVRLAYGREDSQPTQLLSIPGGSLLEIREAHVGLGVSDQTGTLDPMADAALAGGHLLIKSDQTDSFLARILPADGVSVHFDFGVAWSQSGGLRFSGGAALETTFAVDLTLGPLHVDSISLALAARADGIDASVGITGGGTLGPVSASIEKIGLKSHLAFHTGNLGSVDLGFDFKPPVGLGIAIDAGPVTGGGFIEFDPDNGRYAGVLVLSLHSVQVKAIGLLDTKLPNGEAGYSFLVIISVEFTPIQLGFGFTLNGVGGLCGINRNFVTDAIQAGLRQHSLDHILFPKDPVKNAPAIISDLRTIFPPSEGRYVFGPMLELGWGGGVNLVTAELGILLSVPSPVVIAILGQVNVMLPAPDAAVVELHLDVLGIIDFGKKLFSLDASLHDSRIAAFTVCGDMAMRLNWGDNPSFALSIGGMNPHFQPPPGFPALKRLTIALAATDNFRLSIQMYFAITSNTFQLGAHAELYVGAGGFNVYGWLGFDALIIFEPFSFIVDFTAGLALRSGTDTLMGITIDGVLSGPTPWHAKGEAHVSLLFFDIGVHVDITWGESQQVTAPQADVWPLLRDALANVANWSGALARGVPAVVSLAKPTADTASTVLVDPSGALTMLERVCPLDQTLTRFGTAVPGPQNLFHLKTVSLGRQPVPFTTKRDKFAPAQFEQMSDQDKLSRPSFEDRDAGFSIGDELVTFGQGFGLDIAYEDVYVDDEAPPPPPTPVKFVPGLDLQIMWAQAGGAAQSGLRTVAMGKYAPAATVRPLVTLAEETFMVATTGDLTARADISTPTTKGEAYQALAAYLRNNPAEDGDLQVVPVHELAP